MISGKKFMDESTEKNDMPVSGAELASVDNLPPVELAASKKTAISLDKLLMPVAILIAGVMISGTVLYTQMSKNGGLGLTDTTKPAKVLDVSVDDDPTLGNSKAKVTIVEFSDFQCPFCRRFWKETFPVLKNDYIDSGKVKFVYRDFPLQFHPGAEPAAQASECADDQGKFWEMHDKIFEEQEKQGSGTIQFGVTDLKKWARELGLNTAVFNQCLDSGKYKAEVAKDLADGQSYGVSGTPSFFINGKMLVGALPYENFKAEIEAALK